LRYGRYAIINPAHYAQSPLPNTVNPSSLLVSTKFAPPRLGPKAVKRARLLERLREVRHCPLVIVTGSAGFGKTTLLAQWRQELLQSGAEVAWLLLGPGEAAMGPFWSYLASALSRLGIASEDDSLLLGDARDQRMSDAVVTLVVNHAASIAKELFLIIDDYHFVEDPSIHDLLYRLVNQAPENLHVVLAARSQPAIPTGRLLGLGQVAEIVAEELPFDAHEVAEFIKHNVAAKLRLEDAHLIYEHSLGWPAALQLVASRLNRSPRTSATPAALAALSERAGDLGSYLEEDVVRNLPPELVEFLETLSICPRFDAELATAISANTNAARLIQQLDDENLFLTRIEVEERHEWFRMHRLFADFLAARRLRHGADWERQIHHRASRWFAANSLIPEAVRHARLAGDVDFAIEVVTRAATGMRSLVYLGTQLRWIEELAPETVRTNPKLLALGCWALMLSGRPDEAEVWAERLAGAPGQTLDRGANVASQVALVRAGIAMGRDDTAHAEVHLARFAESPPEDPFQSSLVQTSLTLCDVASGQFDRARQRYQRWRAEHNRDLASDHAIVALATLFLASLVEGDVCHVERECPGVLAQADALYGRRSSCANICAALLASAYVERDRIAEAAELLASVGGTLRVATPELMIQASLANARVLCLQGDWRAALASLADAEHRLHERRLDRGVALMLAAQAAIHLTHGDTRRGALIQTGLDTLARRHVETPGWRGEISGIAALAAARLALAEHQSEEALRRLAQAAEEAGRRNRRRTRVIIDLLAGAATADLGQGEASLRHLADAVSAATSLGLLRTVIDELNQLPPAMRDKLLASLAALAADGNTAARDYESLLKAGSNASPLIAAAAAARPPAPASQPALGITAREAEILQLLGRSMSNKRIALTLNVSVETVKWNLRNIYAKIGVSSRYDALSWAKNRGLI
jgi:LuxR family transcriptional regulator, maltose regulon positive regulatory protein